MIPKELIRQNPRRLKYSLAYFLACLDPEEAAALRKRIMQEAGIHRNTLSMAINTKLDDDFSLSGDDLVVLMRTLGCYDIEYIQLNLSSTSNATLP